MTVGILLILEQLQEFFYNTVKSEVFFLVSVGLHNYCLGSEPKHESCQVWFRSCHEYTRLYIE